MTLSVADQRFAAEGRSLEYHLMVVSRSAATSWACGSGKYDECRWNWKVFTYGFPRGGRTGGSSMSMSTSDGEAAGSPPRPLCGASKEVFPAYGHADCLSQKS